MFDDTIEVLTFPTVRDRGRDVPDFTQAPAAVPIAGVDVQPGATTELIAEHREGSAVRYTVFVPLEVIPAGVVLTDKSVVGFDGDRYEVDGKPAKWRHGLPHLVMFLVDWSAQ